ncbi:Glycosidase [Dethiosulfatibacter aminovorans DSM 17477]|uniref:Glycosidase n=1 Tax=Dethiosulfatibacter aminovorans DSM 17477 TaxID=1121476 RepID=A0A1M6ACQ3_9FIRM|nr:glycoside hydrolase family 13 protein [Dethiosulfatibacter aminovorans]SHI34290.1 Glycosidase [Dethiosulfatibacter aminovorans DSM 17477]
MKIFYNSHDEEYKSPFGAVVTGEQVDIRLRVEKGTDISCGVVVMIRAVDVEFEMEEEKQDGDYIVYRAEFSAPNHPCLIHYYFSIREGEDTYYIGNCSEKLGGECCLYYENPVPYQITVASRNIRVPKWYKEGIMYQVYVDRFNKAGDENFYAGRKGFVRYENWNEKNRYMKDDSGDILFWDVYGGNLRGVIEKIPYLREFGVSILYFNPIFESNSNHKYDTGDYEKLDSGYGSDEDFEELVKECDKNGISIILDGVFSHVGMDSKYFNRLGKYENRGAYNSRDSEYFHWFRFKNYPDEYECWWGNKSLPNVEEMNPSYIDYILRGKNSIVKQWMRKGVKGWRLDVADELPDEFIQILKTETLKENADSIVLGEVWEDASNKKSYSKLREYFYGDELDSVMNYPFRKAFTGFLTGYLDGAKALKIIMSIFENYPREYFYSCMNLVGTHDTERILTYLGDSPEERSLDEDTRYGYVLSDEQRGYGVKRLKLLSLIQATFPGVPCIYYGDEAGMEGYSDPYCRGTYPWGNENEEILSWYRKIFKYREGSEVLKRGTWEPYACTGDMFSFTRTLGSKTIVVAVNRSSTDMIFKLPGSGYEDILTGEELDRKTKLKGFGFIFAICSNR